jgi:hypothetical protein
MLSYLQGNHVSFHDTTAWAFGVQDAASAAKLLAEEL